MGTVGDWYEPGGEFADGATDPTGPPPYEDGQRPGAGDQVRLVAVRAEFLRALLAASRQPQEASSRPTAR